MEYQTMRGIPVAIDPGADRLRRRLALAAALIAGPFLSCLRADTIFLKDGTQILDCKVTEESPTSVSARTPVGDMVVPKSKVQRIVRTRSNYDKYQEQLSALREGDVNGLFKLATWCRTTEGLRKESDELLAKVIELKENHPEARRLLGHLKVGGEWIVPPPLTIRLRAGGGKEGDLHTNLGLFLKTRRDVRMADDPDAKSPGGDVLDTCAVDATVIITRKAAGTFYGVSVGQPTLGATVRLQAQSEWIGKTPLKAAAEGQVPAASGNSQLAVQNALGSSSLILHRFLDQLTQLRLKKLEERYRKDGGRKTGEGGPAA